jgi:hypothetical protein
MATASREKLRRGITKAIEPSTAGTHSAIARPLELGPVRQLLTRDLWNGHAYAHLVLLCVAVQVRR